MATKTIQVQKYYIPPIIKQFSKKLYFLVSAFVFEYSDEGYHNRVDVEIYGLSEKEMELLATILMSLPIHYYDDLTIKSNFLNIENFDTNTIQSLVAILPDESKKLLADHILLSLISEENNFDSLFANLKNIFTLKFSKFSKYIQLLPLEAKPVLNFLDFLEGKDSPFIDEYYSKKEQEELRLQYNIKN